MPKMRKLTEPQTTNDQRPMTNGQPPAAVDHFAPPEPARAPALDTAPGAPPLPAWERGTGGEGEPLPPGWVWVRVEQLNDGHEQTVMTGPFGSSLGREYFIDTGVPVLTIGCLTESGLSISKANFISKEKAEELKRYSLKEGDILFSRMATVGRADIVTSRFSESIINYHLMRLRVNNDVIEPKYLVYYIRGSKKVTDYLRDVNHGATRDGINTTQLLNLQVALPPLAEQRRIVEALEAQLTRLDAGVAALRAAKARLRRYRASVLKAACEGRLAPQDPADEPAEELLGRILDERRERWEAEQLARGKDPRRLRYEPPAPPDTDGLPELPRGWVWASAEQLSDETRSITYGVVKLGEHFERGVPTLRSSNVRYLRLDMEGVKNIDPNIANDYKRTFLQGGEILLTVRGTLGGVLVAPDFCVGFNISREVAMIALVEKNIGPLVALFIASPNLQNWLQQKTRGIAYTGINIETLKELPIPLPPLAEQRRIVAEVERRLSVLAEVEAAVEANLRRAERLRQALLRRAFAGRLAPQDPSDEPAGALLERIRQQRAENQEPKTKSRGPKAESRGAEAEGGAPPARRRGRPPKPKQSGQLRLDDL